METPVFQALRMLGPSRGLLQTASVSIELDVAETREACRRIDVAIGCHEILRSSFVAGSYGVGQQVSPEFAIEWEQPCCRSPNAIACGDLLMEGGHVCISPNRDTKGHRIEVHLPMTHADRASFLLLVRELKEDEDPQLPLQYSQYASWKLSTIAAVGVWPRSLSDLLRGGVASPDLPERDTQHWSDDEPEQSLGARTFARSSLDEDGVRSLRATASALDCTPEALVLSVVLATSYRFEHDLGPGGVGMAVDARDRYPDLSTVFGPLTDVIPVDFDIEPEMTLRAVIAAVDERSSVLHTELDRFAWDLIREGALACDPRTSNPRATVFSAASGDAWPSEQRETIDFITSAATNVLFVMHDSGANLVMTSRDSHMPQWRVSGFIRACIHVLKTLPAQLESELAGLQICVQQVVDSTYPAGEVGNELPSGDTAWTILAKQIASTPDRIAIVSETATLTFGELGSQVERCSRQLASSGVGRGSRVAVFDDRSPDMLIAVLSIWALRAAYLPLDPETPAERLAFILHDSNVTKVVSHALFTLPELPQDVDPVVINGGDNAMSNSPAISVASVDPDDLAYIIYTSGTTGEPKGVMIRQGSVVNLLRAHRQRIYRHHDPDEKGLQVGFAASLFFDGSVERLSLLLSGNTLHLLDDQVRRNPEALVAYARRHDVQVLDFTPAALTLAIRSGLLDDHDSPVAAVLVGGEAISPSLWRRITGHPIAFYNVYGPTETTVNAAVGRVIGDHPRLGPPLLNTRLYILDAALQIIPHGVAGELYVAGLGVGLGYLNRPELSAERFIPNPFSDGDTRYARMYATGDRVRATDDGIEFLGRLDGQMKLRGMRIEAGEIEAVINDDPAITDSLVRLDLSDVDDPKLIAYVLTPSSDPKSFEKNLLRRLANKLPRHMLPSAVVPVRGFPLTRNGKVDSARLPAFAQIVDDRSAADASLGTDMERQLAEIWSEVLGRPVVSATDNFFEVGGHSLLMPVLLSRVSEEFGVELPLSTLFVAPTLRLLAARIQSPEGAAVPTA